MDVLRVMEVDEDNRFRDSVYILLLIEFSVCVLCQYSRIIKAYTSVHFTNKIDLEYQIICHCQ